MEDITGKVDIFMSQEMPQIKMHGGGWELQSFEDGEATILLYGACSGCGISPMTVQAIQKRMPNRIDAVNSVTTVIEEDDPTDGPF